MILYLKAKSFNPALTQTQGDLHQSIDIMYRYSFLLSKQIYV